MIPWVVIHPSVRCLARWSVMLLPFGMLEVTCGHFIFRSKQWLSNSMYFHILLKPSWSYEDENAKWDPDSWSGTGSDERRRKGVGSWSFYYSIAVLQHCWVSTWSFKSVALLQNVISQPPEQLEISQEDKHGAYQMQICDCYFIFQKPERPGLSSSICLEIMYIWTQLL